MAKLMLIVMLIFHATYADEVYQNSSHICEKCRCTDEDIFTIDCSNQKFQHVLANWPPHNKSLVGTFSYNNMTTLEKIPITDQKAKLVFDHCNIQYLDRSVFSNIKNVEYIDLSYNLLKTEEIDGDDFKGPYNNKKFHPIAVKYLSLAYNQIHSLPQKFFENMPDLEEVHLEGNDFSVLDPHTQVAISTLSKLKVLNLANNELTEIEPTALKNLQHLEELDLSYNHLDFVPDNVKYLSKTLRVLKLSHNYIFELNDKSFIGLNLIELHLDNLPRLEYVGPNTFATLPNLKNLRLSNNSNLRAIDREAFRENQSLDELHINDNDLRTINYKLLNWSNLKILNMGNNPFVCDCNLHNISASLSATVSKNLDGPICLDNQGRSTPIYTLKEIDCRSEVSPFHITKVAQHFETMRTIMIILSTMLVMGAIILIIVSFLRYKKSVASQNYPFITQVSYNPLQTQYM
ncbi:unnamed protein product [Phaedon cochleariae]|uniref:Uncharacterized protein n=1 Tax=Phaedon cochleariae TaxID=80249 RepID=A0A9P0DL73_PHACE|nr:unnamed protein product [Phaedon cochleariae]